MEFSRMLREAYVRSLQQERVQQLRDALPPHAEFRLWEEATSMLAHFEARESRSGDRVHVTLEPWLESANKVAEQIGDAILDLKVATRNYEDAWARVSDADTWWVE